MNVAFRPSFDHNLDWVSSLRQNEHDLEFEGMIKYKGGEKEP